jgi:hypothetical protein
MLQKETSSENHRNTPVNRFRKPSRPCGKSSLSSIEFTFCSDVFARSQTITQSRDQSWDSRDLFTQGQGRISHGTGRYGPITKSCLVPSCVCHHTRVAAPRGRVRGSFTAVVGIKSRPFQRKGQGTGRGGFWALKQYGEGQGK